MNRKWILYSFKETAALPFSQKKSKGIEQKINVCESGINFQRINKVLTFIN